MANEKTIEAIESRVGSIKEKLNEVQTLEVNLSDIEVNSNGHLVFEGGLLSNDATSEVLSTLQVKKKFIQDYQSRMEPGQVQEIMDLLKESANTPIHLMRHKKENSIIKAATPRQGKTGGFNNPLDIDAFFEYLIDKLRDSRYSFSLDQFYADDFSQRIRIALKNDDDDLFGAEFKKHDKWGTGISMDMSPHRYRISPFYLRLVCTNGMVSPKPLMSTDIKKAKFNMDKILFETGYALTNFPTDIYEGLERRKELVLNTEASLAEFISLRKVLEKEEVQGGLAYKYFDLNPAREAYGISEIEDMPSAWLKSAGSGVKVYDLVNLCTNLETHNEDLAKTDEIREEFGIHSGKLFWKEAYDMKSIAPKVQIDFPEFEEMQ